MYQVILHLFAIIGLVGLLLSAIFALSPPDPSVPGAFINIHCAPEHFVIGLLMNLGAVAVTYALCTRKSNPGWIVCLLVGMASLGSNWWLGSTQSHLTQMFSREADVMTPLQERMGVLTDSANLSVRKCSEVESHVNTVEAGLRQLTARCVTGEEIAVSKAMLTCLSLKYQREPLALLPDARRAAEALMGSGAATIACAGDTWQLQTVP